MLEDARAETRGRRGRLRRGLALACLASTCSLLACGGPSAERRALPFPDGEDAPLVDHDEGGRWLVREPAHLEPLAPGFVRPYPLERIYGTFGDCRPGGRQHRGLDIGGVGEHHGLGTPLRAMVRSEVVSIHRPEDNPARWGRRDTRGGVAERRGHELPRSFVVPGYGEVHFFTRDHGSAHTGVMIVMRGLGGPLDGHQIRFMHLGDVHPGLEPGMVVEAGQEVGLMGSTAILQSLPHVHIDIEDAEGRRVDVAPFLGMPADRTRCGG